MKIMLSTINSYTSQKTNQNPNFKGVFLINRKTATSDFAADAMEDIRYILQSLKDTGERLRFELSPSNEDAFIACERGFDSTIKPLIGLIKEAGGTVKHNGNVDIFSDGGYRGQDLEHATDQKILGIIKGLFLSEK